MRTHQPKGGMCLNCKNADGDCSNLVFEEMPVVGRDGSTLIVRCLEYVKVCPPKASSHQPDGDYAIRSFGTYIRIGLAKNGDVLDERYVQSVPRTGDEISLAGKNGFDRYVVTRVVWAYGETEGPGEWADIGVEHART